jgi:hypothetical protein
MITINNSNKLISNFIRLDKCNRIKLLRDGFTSFIGSLPEYKSELFFNHI